HAELALDVGLRDVGVDQPVVVDAELVVEADRIQAVLDGVAVHADDRVHLAPGRGGGRLALDREVVQRHAGRAPDRAELHAGLDLGLLELGMEPVQRPFVEIVGLELQGRGDAGALVVVVEAIQLAAAQHLDARVARQVGVAPGLVLVARLRAVHLRDRDHHAEAVVGELVDVGRAEAVAALLLVADLVLVVARVGADDAFAEGERAHGLQVDGAGQALPDQRGVRRLVDHDLAQQLGRILVELDAAVVAGAGLLAAVEGGGGEVAGEAADVDLGGAAALALRGQAGQAGDGFGDARVRQLADVLGGNRLDDRSRGLLGVDRLLDAAADAGHGDAVEFGGFLRGRGVGLL